IFSTQFTQEKYWQTLEAIMVAPVNKINLLIGIIFGYLLSIAIPYFLVFTICYFYYPISFLTIIFIFIIYTLISLIFSGMGLILGVVTISKENYSNFINFFLNFLFLFSCITYPFEIFPPEIQSIINLNPFYYIFSIIRLTWIENNILSTFNSHLYNFLLLIILAIIIVYLGIFFFNYMFKKYGIVGY
ncbi:MAG: ABC transporter permease, partial [Promethearchaeota archaeon]